VRALVWVFLLIVGCDRYVRAPVSDYSNLDSSAAGEWDVTSGDRVYRVTQLTVTDSTVVLEKVSWIQQRHLGGHRSLRRKTEA